ncbi:septum formation initiator family protein [Bacillus tianshenii]|nr:septum formation initiator family protein [Bacillus tianshenii]
MQTERKRNITKIRSSYTVQQDRKQDIARLKKKRLFQRLVMFAIVALIVTGGMIVTLISQSQAIEKKEIEKAELEEELAVLQKDERNLKEEITKLNDIDYIKKIARRDYFFSEEGEVIFQFSDE